MGQTGVADKGRIRRDIKKLQYVKTWQLVILLIIALLVAATFLRLNNIGMVERREAVFSADQEGNQTILIQRLYDLQRYVSAHMNTDLGQGVPLQASFNRDLEAWNKTQYGDDNPNGNIYQKAQDVCAPQFNSWSPAYVLCISSELAKYPPAEGTASDSSRPREATYVHNFASPLWSPDFAGWSVVVCALILLLIIIRLVTLGVLRLMLRHHYRNI